MSEEINKLKAIGAQRIYEDTHIALVYIKSVIDENFQALDKVQFVGFISILEREYSLDLSELKKKGLVHFEQEEPSKEEVKQGVFVVPQRKRKYTYIYIILIVIAFLIVALSSNSQEEKVSQTTTTKLDNKAIDTAKKVIKPTVAVEDKNITEEKKEEVVVAKKTIVPEKTIIAKSLKVIPRTKVWVGYIDKDAKVKKQKVTSKPFSLDAQHSWLLSFGHGNISIEVNGKVMKYNSPNSMRFLYEDGKLKELSISEFKAMNKGRLW